MKILRHILKITKFLLIASITLYSCSDKAHPEIPIGKMNVNLPMEYKVTYYKHDWSIGDDWYEYRLLIAPKQFKEVVKQIESKSYFLSLSLSQSPLTTIGTNADLSKTNEVAFKRDNEYYYEVFVPRTHEVISLILANDSIVTIHARDL